MTIGERIKQRRLELGLTQTELAHRMGLTSKTTICKAETTDFNPTTDRVREFAKALDTTPAFLMCWVDNPDPKYDPTDTDITYPEDEASLSDEDSIELQVKMLIKKYGIDAINKAINLFSLYEQAPSDVRSAIEILLKSQQSDV